MSTVALSAPKAKAAGPPAKTAVAAPAVPHLYFISTFVDFTLIGGLSILTFIALRLFYSDQRTPVVYETAVWLLYLCNWPHFAATNYRLYHAKANILQYPMTALVIPWLIVAAMIGSVLSPALIAVYFIKVYLIWSPYHFSGQTIGITLIYARRGGFQVGRWERLGLSLFVFGTFISQTLRSEIIPPGVNPDFFPSYNDFYTIPYPKLGLPAWTLDVAVAVMWLGGLLFMTLAARWSLKNKRILPAIIILPAVTQFFWFVQSSGWLSFQEFVPFFHGLQYMLIAWGMQLKEKMDLKQITPSRHYVVFETARWWGINLVIGLLLFKGMPMLFASLTGVTALFATGVVVAGIQIHHFFVDGVIWKLKRKTVSSPLMVNLDDLLGQPDIARRGK